MRAEGPEWFGRDGPVPGGARVRLDEPDGHEPPRRVRPAARSAIAADGTRRFANAEPVVDEAAVAHRHDDAAMARADVAGRAPAPRRRGVSGARTL